MNLPSAFLTRMQEMLGEEYEAFLQSYESGHYQSLRLNPRKTDREEFTEKSPFHLTPVALSLIHICMASAATKTRSQ